MTSPSSPVPIGLGMPAGPPPTLALRRQTRQIRVGDVGVGSESPISVQSLNSALENTSVAPTISPLMNSGRIFTSTRTRCPLLWCK